MIILKHDSLISSKNKTSIINEITSTITITAFCIASYGIIELLGISFIPHAKGFFETYHFPLVSTLGNPNFVGEYLVASLPFALYLCFVKKSKFGLISLPIILITIYFTFSKAVWLSLGIILLIWIVFGIIRYKSLWLDSVKIVLIKTLFICVIMIITFVSVLLITPYNTPSSGINLYSENENTNIDNDKNQKEDINTKESRWKRSSFEGRIYINKISLDILKNNFITGIGIKNFNKEWLLKQAEYLDSLGNNKRSIDQKRYFSNLSFAHNEYVQLILNFGLISILFILFVILISIFTIYRLIRSKDWSNKETLIFFFLISIIAQSITSLVAFPLHNISSSLLFFVSIGVLLNFVLNSENKFMISLNKDFKRYFYSYLLIIVLIILNVLFIYPSIKAFSQSKIEYDLIDEINNRNYQIADEIANELIEYDEQNPIYNFYKAQLLLKLGKNEQSQEYYKKVQYGEYFLNSLYEIASYYEKKGDWKNAMKYYNKMLYYEPLNIYALGKKSLIFKYTGKQKESDNIQAFIKKYDLK